MEVLGPLQVKVLDDIRNLTVKQEGEETSEKLYFFVVLQGVISLDL